MSELREQLIMLEEKYNLFTKGLTIKKQDNE